MSHKLPPCDPDVFSRGKVLALIGDFNSVALEGLFSKIRPLLREGMKLDFHMAAGRYMVKCLEHPAAPQGAD